MKKNNYGIISLLIIVLIVAGCEKNDTKGYPDPEDPGIAIFSNTGNNILSCYIDNKPWRTIDRITPILSAQQYELNIRKQVTGSSSDTLEFLWTGYYSSNSNSLGVLLCRFAVPKNFSYKSFSGLKAQRISINNSNGYFTNDINLGNNSKGPGNIYFHTATLDSIGPNTYTGKMSGIFDASLPALKITKGRFDHTIIPAQIYF
jgi:hypothetical protein